MTDAARGRSRGTLVRDLRNLAREVTGAPYYRSRPWDIPGLLAARWAMSRANVGPRSFLEGLGVPDLDALIADFQARDSLFAQVRESMDRAHREEGEQGGVSPDDGLALYCLARWLRPGHIIETGVAAGVSTTYLLAALADNGAGRMWSVELPSEVVAQHAEDGSTYTWGRHGPGWAIPTSVVAEVGDRWVLVLEDVRSALPRLLAEVGTVDLFFHDDLHTPAHMAWEYELAWRSLTPGGVLVSDDVNRAWIRFCRRHGQPQRGAPNAGRFAAVIKPAEPGWQ